MGVPADDQRESLLESHTFDLQASARLRKNAAYFRTNYIIVLTTSILLSFLMHPSSLLVLGLLSAAWVYLLALRTGPVVINGRELRWGQDHVYVCVRVWVYDACV